MSYCTVRTGTGADGTPAATSLSLVIRQPAPRAPLIAVDLPAGHGHPGLVLADQQRQRLRPGTRCQVVGGVLRSTADPRTLCIQGAQHIRTVKDAPPCL